MELASRAHLSSAKRYPINSNLSACARIAHERGARHPAVSSPPPAQRRASPSWRTPSPANSAPSSSIAHSPKVGMGATLASGNALKLTVTSQSAVTGSVMKVSPDRTPGQLLLTLSTAKPAPGTTLRLVLAPLTMVCAPLGQTLPPAPTMGVTVTKAPAAVQPKYHGVPATAFQLASSAL